MSYRLNDNQTFITESAFSYHHQNSFFGTTEYIAKQSIYYFNFSHILNWKNHKLNSGIQYKSQNLDTIE